MAHIITYLYCRSHRYCGTTSKGTVQCRAILLICTVDLPARAMVCNMKQYNVEYSCCTCLEMRDNIVTSNKLVRYWPYNESYVIWICDTVAAAYAKATFNWVPVCFCFMTIIILMF